MFTVKAQTGDHWHFMEADEVRVGGDEYEPSVVALIGDRQHRIVVTYAVIGVEGDASTAHAVFIENAAGQTTHIVRGGVAQRPNQP